MLRTLRPRLPVSISLLAQSGIEHMREPDTCFLQLLPDDRRVRLHIGSVDLHFRRGRKLARGTFVVAVFRLWTFSNREWFVGPICRI